MSTILQNDFTYSLPAYFQYISVLGEVESYSDLPPEVGCINYLTALCPKLILVHVAIWKQTCAPFSSKTDEKTIEISDECEVNALL